MQGTRRGIPDWEAVRLSLEVVRKGSFRAAAEHLNMSVNALRRRVDELEEALGITLLTRHVDGVRITSEGEKVFAAATRMEAASFGSASGPRRNRRQRLGRSAPSGYRRTGNSGLRHAWSSSSAPIPSSIDVNCAMKSADVLRLEADVAIQITRPTALDLRLVKLGRLHFFPSPRRAISKHSGIRRRRLISSIIDSHSIRRQCSVA